MREQMKKQTETIDVAIINDGGAYRDWVEKRL
jgi:hypothetical protein